LYSGLENKIVGGTIGSSKDGYTINTINIPSITTPTSSMSIWLNIKNTETTSSDYIHIFCFSHANSITMNKGNTVIYSLNIHKNTSVLSFCPYLKTDQLTEFEKNNLIITNKILYDKWTNVFINITNNAIFEFYINGKLEQTYKIKQNITDLINYVHNNKPLQYCVMLKPNNDDDCDKFDISIAHFQRWLYNKKPDEIMKIYNAGFGIQFPLWNAGISYMYDDKMIQRRTLFETRDLHSVLL